MFVLCCLALLAALLSVAWVAPLERIERLLDDGPIGMAEAARLMGTFRGGRPCHPSTITRWCLAGVKRPDGTVLRLAHFRTAGRLYTSKPALLEFLAAQQPDDLTDAPSRTPAARDRAAEAAGRQLKDEYDI